MRPRFSYIQAFGWDPLRTVHLEFTAHRFLDPGLQENAVPDILRSVRESGEILSDAEAHVCGCRV